MLYKKYSLLLPKLLIYGNERSSTVFHFCSKTRMYQTVLQFFIFFLIFYKSYYIFLKSLVKQLSNEVLHLTFTYIQAELWTVQRKLWYNCSKSAWCYVRGVSTYQDVCKCVQSLFRSNDFLSKPRNGLQQLGGPSIFGD